MCVSATITPWEQAVQHHLAGRFAEAETIYRELLVANRDDDKALHMLGVLRFQQGDAAAGAVLVQRAVAIAPRVAKYHGHHGLILASIGNGAAAIDAYRRALVIEPGASEVLNNLGIALLNQGDVAGATDAYRRALGAQPPMAEAATNLGLALIQLGDHAQAVAALEAALSLRPGDASTAASLATACNNLGVDLERREDVQDAIASFSRALSIKPDFPEAHFNLGRVLASLNRDEEAIASYGRAIELTPVMADAHNNLGIVLARRGNNPQAIASFHEALRQRPGDTRPLNNLAGVLRSCGRLNDAISTYRRALELQPGDAEIWSNLGSALDARGDFTEAIGALDKAVALRPDFSQAHNNIANALKNAGDIDGALAAYQRAIDIDPANQSAQSNRLYTLYFHPGYSPQRILQEHQQWNAAHAAPRGSRTVNPTGGSSPPRLRAGYVAPNFREHCQSFFTVPLFSHHDHDRVEVIAYSDVAAEDAITARLRSYCDGWRNIAGKGDSAVADRIREDRIDILVDLSLHMADNRLLVFARKPAPLQITWLGYPGTTGLSTIDYRLTDPHLDPPSGESDASYSEKSYRLPRTFWCYHPLTSEPLVNALPAESKGYVTFGCLNNFCKVTDPTLRLWSAVLRAVPKSRLVLLAPRTARMRVLETMGISADRIDFVDRMARAQYLATYHRVDIGLETIPYNGHTTTLDAMWMGVPVVTLIGNSPAGRAGWSQLSNLALQRLAASSPEEFVQILASLTDNPRELACLRRTLRDRMTNSPLMDGARFARDMESAYFAIWRASVSA